MDFELFKLVNQFAGQSHLADIVMLALARYGPLLFALPLLYLWFAGGTRGMEPGGIAGKKAALLALVSLALALLIAQAIGYAYFRDRPFASHEVNLLVDRSTDPSFPSDHVTFSFAIAGIVWLQDRRIGWPALILGGLIALSRVFVGTHYPLDVIGGALVGLGAAALVWKARKKFDPLTSFVITVARKLKLA